MPRSFHSCTARGGGSFLSFGGFEVWRFEGLEVLEVWRFGGLAGRVITVEKTRKLFEKMGDRSGVDHQGSLRLVR